MKGQKNSYTDCLFLKFGYILFCLVFTEHAPGCCTFLGHLFQRVCPVSLIMSQMENNSLQQSETNLGILEPGRVTNSVIISMNISFLLLEVVLATLSLYTSEIIVFVLFFINILLWFSLNLIIMNMKTSKLKTK
eukprot:NODE_11_length_46995_cov_0.451872.p24 type:complete len:134 gc:universal NODE_11_length_46995_cov_0.451872:39-440(+)